MNTFQRRHFVAAFAGVVFLFLSPAVNAQQKITPSHVLQVVDNTVAELALLLDANFSDPSVPDPVTIKGKRPRHVIQKARQILLKVQLLKDINGLPVKDLEPIAVREIRPADVKGWVDQLLASVRDLRVPYKVTTAPRAAQLVDKKTPSDVFQRLLQAEAMVERLELPATVPNDVYRVALSVVSDMRAVAEKAGVTETIAWEGRTASGKTPNDIYNVSYVLLEALRDLTSYNEALKIPGGIAMPQQKVGRLTPGDVIEIQNMVLAELSSIKFKIKATEPTKVFGPQAGKTPSDTFVAVQAAQEYADLMSQAIDNGSLAK